MATPTSLPATFVAGNVLTAAQMNDLRGAFRILQIVQTVKTSSFTTTSSSLVDVTGFSVTITPTSATSKVLVQVSAGLSRGSNVPSKFSVFRGDAATGTNLASPASSFGEFQADTNPAGWVSINYLDSPATTSATTYQGAMSSPSGGTAVFQAEAATITVMEVSA